MEAELCFAAGDGGGAGIRTEWPNASAVARELLIDPLSLATAMKRVEEHSSQSQEYLASQYVKAVTRWSQNDLANTGDITPEARDLALLAGQFGTILDKGIHTFYWECHIPQIQRCVDMLNASSGEEGLHDGPEALSASVLSTTFELYSTRQTLPSSSEVKWMASNDLNPTQWAPAQRRFTRVVTDQSLRVVTSLERANDLLYALDYRHGNNMRYMNSIYDPVRIMRTYRNYLETLRVEMSKPLQGETLQMASGMTNN